MELKREVKFELCLLEMKMKFRLLLIFSSILLLNGCAKKDTNLDNYEHYNLTGKDIAVVYNYYFEDNSKNYKYVIADITPENSDVVINGLFCQISNDDYILLDTFESKGNQINYRNRNTYIYEGKLYIIRNIYSSKIMEYSLHGINIEKNEFIVEFDDRRLILSYIENVDNEYIYLYGRIYGSGSTAINSNQYLHVKCSKIDHKCKINS